MSAAPATRPFLVTRADLHAVPKPRARVMPSVASRLALFVAIALATHLAASLSGYVLLEAARKEGIQADLRAKAARSAELKLRRSVDALSSVLSVQEWALSNGFVATEPSARPSLGVVRVASSLE